MSNLDWDMVRVFLGTHRAGSFRQAAEKLACGHATIRRSVLALEAELGAQVFNRSQNGLTLTQAGETLLALALNMEHQANRISRQLRDIDARPAGTVRISVSPALAHGFLTPMIAEFSIQYPQINVSVIATNKVSDLNKNEADVSLRVANHVEDDVVGRRLLKLAIGPFASPKYLEQHPDIVEKQGEGAEWIGWGRTNNWINETALPKAKARHRLPEVLMQIEGAANHMGLGSVPCFLGDLDPRVVRVPGIEPSGGRSLWLLMHDERRKTARGRALVDFLSDKILANRAKFTQ